MYVHVRVALLGVNLSIVVVVGARDPPTYYLTRLLS